MLSTEQVELLTELWNEGLLSASEIGARIGASKNSVIGKAHRMHLTSRKPGPTARGPHYLRKIRKRPRIVLPEEPELRAPTHECGSPVGILEAGHFHCRWPVTEVKPIAAFLFCGDQKADGSAYCGLHTRMSMQGTQQEHRTRISAELSCVPAVKP